MKRNLSIGLALVLALALLAACGDKTEKEKVAEAEKGTETETAAETDTEKTKLTVEESTLTKVGQPAPDFTVATLSGGPFTLSDYRGKIVLVNWFATWCKPCVEEMPHLQEEVWKKFPTTFGCPSALVCSCYRQFCSGGSLSAQNASRITRRSQCTQERINANTS